MDFYFFKVDEPFITKDPVYDSWVVIAGIYTIFVILGSFFFSAGYGKFNDPRFGFELDPRVGWWLMELPATLSFSYFYWTSPKAWEPQRLFCAFLFLRHYANRGWFFPWSIRVAKGKKASFSVSVIAFGVFFTSLHGYFNGLWFAKHAPGLSEISWFYSPYFIIGYPMYEIAFWSTLHSEYIQRNLRDPRKNNDTAYKIPYGGLFDYVTNATYFGELMAWLGWALWTRSPGGVFVFAVSFANLFPRAFKQHEWYQKKFENYPKNRKVIVPFLL